MAFPIALDSPSQSNDSRRGDEVVRVARGEKRAANSADDFKELARTVPVNGADLNCAALLHRPIPNVPGYEVLSLLGEGGMGVVYLARQTTLKRLVALKMIASDYGVASARRRFQTEAEAVARLQHPHIVQIYEIGEHQGRPFLALELMEGGTLAHTLKADGPLLARDAAVLVGILARAMQHAHERGVVHRDLKPANVLLSSEVGPHSADCGEPKFLGSRCEFRIPKISDFGLAKTLDTDLGRTRSAAILGTPAYMAPEQADGKHRTVGPAADIYALGAVLYECLTGRPPFSGESCWEILQQVVGAEPVSPSRYRPRLARDLDTICLKALAKDPARRYETAADLATDLEHFAAGEAIAARPESGWRKLGRRVRRRPVAVAGLLLLLGATVFAGLTWKIRRSDAADALYQGRKHAGSGAVQEARASFERGLESVKYIPGSDVLRRSLQGELAVEQLHTLAEQLRFRHDANELDDGDRSRLTGNCAAIWQARNELLAFEPDIDRHAAERLRADLLDIGLLELQLRDGTQPHDPAADQAALERLDELEAISGISPVIVHERLIYRTRLGRPINDAEQQSAEPTTAAEFHQLGRAMFHEGEFEKAARLFDRGLREDPAALFMNFDRAQCAMALGRHDDAIQSFTACVALNPGPVIFARRAEALAARATSHERRIAGSIAGWCEVLADRAAARADYLAALRRSDNKLAEAWFGLGLLDARQRKFGAAEQNFVKALQTGHPEAPVRVNLAIVQAETGRLSAAIGNARRAVALRPNDAEAKALLDKLEKESIPNRRPLTGTISAIKQWETIQ